MASPRVGTSGAEAVYDSSALRDLELDASARTGGCPAGHPGVLTSKGIPALTNQLETDELENAAELARRIREKRTQA